MTVHIQINMLHTFLFYAVVFLHSERLRSPLKTIPARATFSSTAYSSALHLEAVRTHTEHHHDYHRKLGRFNQDDFCNSYSILHDFLGNPAIDSGFPKIPVASAL